MSAGHRRDRGTCVPGAQEGGCPGSPQLEVGSRQAEAGMGCCAGATGAGRGVKSKLGAGASGTGWEPLREAGEEQGACRVRPCRGGKD